MNKEVQKYLDDQMEYLLKDNLIDQDTKYARHLKEVLKQLA